MLTDGKVQGIAIDYLTHIFNINGIKIKYISEVDVTWPEALEYIKRHEVVDMVPTAKITNDRKNDMIFTDEYIFAPWVIFTRTDSDFISSIGDLNGKTISVEEGYVMHQRLKQDYPGIHLKVVSASLENFAEIPIKDLSTGLVDAYIGNLLSTTYTIQTKGYTNVKVAAPTPFDNHNQAMAIRSDWPELAGIINKTLASMTPEEHLAIRHKWLSIRYEYGINKVYVLKWVLGVSGIASLFVVFVLIWNKRLKKEVVSRKKTETELIKNLQLLDYTNVELKREIAERKKVDDELRISKDLFLTMFEQAPLGIALIDSQTGHIHEVNPKFAEITGKPKEEMLKIDWMKITHPDDIQEDLDNMALLNAGKITGFDMNKRYIRFDGSIVWVHMTITPIDWENQAHLRHLCMIEDITESKQVEAERVKLELKLQQAQKMESIGTLAGGIAHDFNNILSSIIGFTELALGSVEEGTELEDDLQEVRMAGMRAKELVKQILSFARQSDETVKPIQVNALVNEVLKFIKSSIPATIQINEIINSDSFIMGSPTQVHQILINLCTNASQAMETNGGILDVSLKDVTIDRTSAIPNLRHGEYIKINVTDTGMGISPQNIDTIFEPYFTTKAVGEGTGLGLAVVHGIVESYGGKITVESKENKGTSFSVYLPITKKRKRHPPSQKNVLPSGKEHILFVDDEAAIAKMGSKVLEQLGYTVTIRTSSIEALELFRSKPKEFDLVITDMTMPNMTGDKLSVELIKIRSDIPVILCTGYSKTIFEETAAEIGIKAFIDKPVVKSDLARTVRNVLDENGIPAKA